jgi:NAD-dependent deacetylase
MNTIDLRNHKSIVILTGAGISAASGIRTYRDANGYWNEGDLIKYSSHSIINEDPVGFWRFMSDMRKTCQQANPNISHGILAEIEAHLEADQKMTLVTQNIDGLHHRAGSSHVIELHGNIHNTKCSNFLCDFESAPDTALYYDNLPKCPVCGGMLRPDVVLFEEFIDPVKSKDVLHAFADCDLFIAIGTSASVYPANKFVEWAWKRNAKTVFINTQSIKNRNHPTSYNFNIEYIGKAENIMPHVFSDGIFEDVIFNDEKLEELESID